MNPHAWVYIEVEKDDGTFEQWMIEGGTPNTLFRRGFSKKSVLPGTMVVNGYRAKDGSLKANGRDLTFPDGRKLFMGSSGTGAPKDGPDAVFRRMHRHEFSFKRDTRLANLVYPVVGSRVWNTPLALSQDGGTVYFIGEHHGQRRIYRRALAQGEAEEVRGTEGAKLVFLSPDGDWLGFSVLRQLKKMRLAGDAPVTFHEGRVEYARWGPDNIVVFLENGELWQIDTVGGEPKQITSGGGFKTHSFLPGGQAVLAADSSMVGRVMLVPLSKGEPQVLTIGTAPQFVPSGHIVFLRGTSLWAIPFDLDRLEVTGSAVQVLEGVVERGILPNYVLSPSGSLVYVPTRGAAPVQQLVWLGRDGREELLGLEPGSYRIPRLSPDQSRVVFDDCCQETEPPVADIWIYDLVSRNRIHLTFDPAGEAHPAWTPDGKRVAFFSLPSAVSTGAIVLKAATGTGDVTRLVESTNPVPQAFSPDGQILIYSDARDIYMLQLEGEPTSKPILSTPALESGAYISPDSQWLAYASDESGRSEIYVRPFPNVDDGRWQVSTDGGAEAAWAHDGSELYYRNGDSMIRVAVDITSTFSYGPPEVLFEGHYDTHRARNYDVARDGRFLMVKDVTPGDRTSARQHLMIIQNWNAELARIFAEVE